MRLGGWLFFENIVDKGAGVASVPVTIYWLGLEITQVKPQKPSWLISLFAYLRSLKWLGHSYSPHPHPLDVLCHIATMRPLYFSR